VGADWLRVKTATGAIEVRGGSDDAGLSTVSGAIRVSDGRYERGKFETVTGDITYRGDVGFKGSMDVTTHSGRVELQLPPRPDLELDAATVTGSIENSATSTRPITGREGRGMELGFSSGSGNTRVVVRSFNGESIGKWEGDTLVVDTRYFVGHHHWIDSGVPASEDLHIIERIKMINNGQALEIEYTFEDPKTFEGQWKTTKRWQRTVDRDIAEVSCLPDLNDHMPSTRSTDNVR
jgi:hypothetical protein